MTQHTANQISTMLGSAHMQALSAEENRDWIENQRGDPFPVRYKPAPKKPARTKRESRAKGDDLNGWNRVIQDMGKK